DVPIIAPRGSAPGSTAPPTISGSPVVAAIVTIAPGTWSGSSPIAFAYAWQRCNASGANCARISGATGRSYRVTSADVGDTLRGSVAAAHLLAPTTTLTPPTAVDTSPQPAGAT